MAERQAPPISKEVVEWLEDIYPDRLPDPATPIQEIYAHCGAAKVVRKVRQEYLKQLNGKR